LERFLQNIDSCLPNYMVSHPRWLIRVIISLLLFIPIDSTSVLCIKRTYALALA
jgi:hypothetical protein